MESIVPKQIVILLQPEGNIVARHTEMGKAIGEFSLTASGEIYFRYFQVASRTFYVNKNMTAFRQAAGVFNKCCDLHADDENTDDPAVWDIISEQLNSDFERIEPLGDPESSLWSATIHDTEYGLLSLF